MMKRIFRPILADLPLITPILRGDTIILSADGRGRARSALGDEQKTLPAAWPVGWGGWLAGLFFGEMALLNRSHNHGTENQCYICQSNENIFHGNHSIQVRWKGFHLSTLALLLSMLTNLEAVTLFV